MKKPICIFISLFLLFSLASCSGLAEFGFEYSADQTALAPGEVLKVTATVENISVFTYTYIGSSGDYFPEAWLYPVLGDGTLGEAVNPDGGVVLPTDVVTHRIKKGDRGSYTYEFTLPEGFYGEYVLKLAFAGQSKIFNDVVTVTGINGASPDYSPTFIKSGAQAIRPISCYLASTTYKNGSIVSTDDGGGADYFFTSKPDHSTFPAIVLEGELDIMPPVHYFCTDYRVFDTDLNLIDPSFDTVHELSALSPGEYIIVYHEEYDTRGDAADDNIREYSIIESNGIFKLIVPEK